MAPSVDTSSVSVSNIPDCSEGVALSPIGSYDSDDAARQAFQQEAGDSALSNQDLNKVCKKVNETISRGTFNYFLPASDPAPDPLELDPEAQANLEYLEKGTFYLEDKRGEAYALVAKKDELIGEISGLYQQIEGLEVALALFEAQKVESKDEGPSAWVLGGSLVGGGLLVAALFGPLQPLLQRGVQALYSFRFSRVLSAPTAEWAALNQTRAWLASEGCAEPLPPSFFARPVFLDLLINGSLLGGMIYGSGKALAYYKDGQLEEIKESVANLAQQALGDLDTEAKIKALEEKSQREPWNKDLSTITQLSEITALVEARQLEINALILEKEELISQANSLSDQISQLRSEEKVESLEQGLMGALIEENPHLTGVLAYQVQQEASEGFFTQDSSPLPLVLGATVFGLAVWTGALRIRGDAFRSFRLSTRQALYQRDLGGRVNQRANKIQQIVQGKHFDWLKSCQERTSEKLEALPEGMRPEGVRLSGDRPLTPEQVQAVEAQQQRKALGLALVGMSKFYEVMPNPQAYYDKYFAPLAVFESHSLGAVASMEDSLRVPASREPVRGFLSVASLREGLKMARSLMRWTPVGRRVPAKARAL